MRHRSSTPLPYAKTQPAYDERTPRRGQDNGGTPFAGRQRGGMPPPEYAQLPPTTNDRGIHRERGPWMHSGNHIPLAEPLRQTDAGPIRSEMHMRTHQWRRWSGGRHGDRTGWHSMLPDAQHQEPSGRRQQKRPRASKLTRQRFTQQSYSDTTEPIDRGRHGG